MKSRHQVEKRLRREPSEIAELVKKAVERLVPHGRVEVGLDLGVGFDQHEKIIPAHAQDIDRCAAAHGGGTLASTEQRQLAKFIARAQRLQRELLALFRFLEHPRAARCQDIKGIGFIALVDDDVSELEVLLVEQTLQRRKVGFRHEAQQR